MTNFWTKLKKGFTVLAPMEEVTDIVFRQIIIDCGRPDVLFTEFTSTDGLMSKGRDNVIRRLKFNKNEHPIVAQIWGNKPENYLGAGKILQEMGFDGIDINMGCPVANVVKKGCCSRLIENPTLAAEIIQAAKEGAGDLPVSVKTRIGYNKVVTEEWASFLLEQDIAALTMHGRTRKQMSKVPCDWDEIGKVVNVRKNMINNVPTVIIGNGDIMSLDESDEKVEKYGVDGVMIGRGIFKDPFIFNPNRALEDLSLKERLELLHKHTSLFVKTWGESRNFAVMKKFFKIYISGFDGAVEMRVKLMEANNIDEVETVLNSFMQ